MVKSFKSQGSQQRGGCGKYGPFNGKRNKIIFHEISKFMTTLTPTLTQDFKYIKRHILGQKQNLIWVYVKFEKCSSETNIFLIKFHLRQPMNRHFYLHCIVFITFFPVNFSIFAVGTISKAKFFCSVRNVDWLDNFLLWKFSDKKNSKITTSSTGNRDRTLWNVQYQEV